MSIGNKTEFKAERGGDGWYIIVGVNDDEDGVNLGSPIRADSPGDAVNKRAMYHYDTIKVYQLREKPTRKAEFWDKDDLELPEGVN